MNCFGTSLRDQPALDLRNISYSCTYTITLIYFYNFIEKFDKHKLKKFDKFGKNAIKNE